MDETRALTAEEYLRIPYLLEMWSVQSSSGEWLRHAEFPELPGCVVETSNATEAMEKVEEARVEYILTRMARQEPVPVPRPPLRA